MPLVEQSLRDIKPDRLDVAGRCGGQLLSEQPREMAGTEVEMPGEFT
jgi:hypothetical protein